MNFGVPPPRTANINIPSQPQESKSAEQDDLFSDITEQQSRRQQTQQQQTPTTSNESDTSSMARENTGWSRPGSEIDPASPPINPQIEDYDGTDDLVSPRPPQQQQDFLDFENVMILSVTSPDGRQEFVTTPRSVGGLA